MAEFPGIGARRFPDLALIGRSAIEPLTDSPNPVPVLSIRSIRGIVPPRIFQLADLLGEFNVYVQSDTSGNDDRPATAELGERPVVARDELTSTGQRTQPRVVVAVRLHAALMALRAGHYVVHLAYERKGFGAFSDLGISDYVHNVNRFDVDRVKSQVEELVTSAEARRRYREAIDSTSGPRHEARQRLVGELKAAHRLQQST